MESNNQSEGGKGKYFEIFIVILVAVLAAYFYFKIVSPTQFSVSSITTTPMPMTTTPMPTTTPPTTTPPTTTAAPVSILPTIPSNFVLIPDGTYDKTKTFTNNDTTFSLDAGGDLTMRYKSNLIWISGSKEGATKYTVLNGVITMSNDTNTNLWSTSSLLASGVSLSPSGTYATYLIDAAKLGIVDTKTNTVFTTYLDGMTVVQIPNNTFGKADDSTILVGYCQFKMQLDGNFVMYLLSNPYNVAIPGYTAIWSSDTNNGYAINLDTKTGILAIVDSNNIIIKKLATTSIGANMYFKANGQIVSIDSSGVSNILVDASQSYYSTLSTFTF